LYPYGIIPLTRCRFARLCASASIVRSLIWFPLQLRQRRDRREEEPAHRRRRVDLLGDADQVRPCLCQPLGDLDGIARRSGEGRESE
jgi:hypothetical protein